MGDDCNTGPDEIGDRGQSDGGSELIPGSGSPEKPMPFSEWGIVQVEAQGHLLKAHVPGAAGVPPWGGGIRGSVTRFSRASRKRLLELFARLRPDCKPLFIDLTFPDGGGRFKQDQYQSGTLPSQQETYQLFRAFVKRLERAYPGRDIAVLWRFEKESSGQREYNPHVHCVVFGVGFIPVESVRTMWCEIIGATFARVGISAPVTWYGRMWYLSKRVAYIAKGEPPREIESYADEHGDGSEAFLVNGAYRAVGESETQGSGRYWGVLGRENLPFAPVARFEVKLGPWFWDWKRSARRFWRGVNDARYHGFTLFTQNVARWIELAVYSGGELRPVAA